MSAPITLVGRVASEPELRFSPSGTPIVKLSIVTSRRSKDPNTNEWSDADVTFWDCVAFRQTAENIAESLVKGMSVVATGHAVQESWEDRATGAKRSKTAVRIDDIGPSLRFATAKVTKAQRGQEPNRPQNQQPAQGDPWGQPTQHGQNSGWGVPQQQDSPPF